MRNFGLIGQSLVHSFSKDYFNKKFKTENIDALYSNFEIENTSSLRDLFSNHNLSGLNVTIPFKQKVISQLDSLDEIERLKNIKDKVNKSNIEKKVFFMEPLSMNINLD